MGKINLSDYDFTDLQNYPNVGKNKFGDLEELSFNGNFLLRTNGSKLAMTEDAKKEKEKCANDFKYFISTYINIQTIDHGIIPFKLRKFQDDILKIINKNSKAILRIARQCGKTTTVSAYISWCLCFKKDFNIGIVANTGELTLEIVSMIKQMIELLPAFLKPAVKRWNAKSIALENGSRILSAVAGPSALRGRALSLLYIDECAFIDETKINGFFDSVMPALSSGTKTKIIITSTPKGFNTFYNLYKDAEAGKNGYVPYMGTWRVIPERTEEWKRKEIESTSLDQFLQNHEVAWLGSSKTLLSKECLSDLPANKQVPIGTLDWIHEDFKVYQYPIQESEDDIFYSVGVDSSKISPTANRNSDFISIQVTEFNKTQKTIRQAATLRTRDMHYLESSELIYEVATYYNDALVLVENNSEGQGIVDTLFDKYEYENIYSSEKRNDIMGFRTTPKSKRIGLANLKKLIENGVLKLYDIDTIDEFFTFVKVGNTFKANSTDAHDDAIMALVACIQFLVDEMNETELTLWDFIMDKVDAIDRDEDGEQTSKEDLDIMLSSRTGTSTEDMKWLLGA